MAQRWLMASLEPLWELYGQELCRLLSHTKGQSQPRHLQGSSSGSREALVLLVCAPELQQRTLLV